MAMATVTAKAREAAAESAAEAISISELLERGRLEMHFQPIISVRRGSVLGVEALVRARSETGAIIPPNALFRAAHEQNCTQSLDEHCQSLALQSFAPLHRAAPNLLLFLNVDAVSLLHSDESDDADDEILFLGKEAQHYGIDPRNIAVEILEGRFPSVERLKRAVARYRRSGFLVVLDDLGAGDSNLDRITQVQPDLIKADRSLVQGICGDSLKQEVFKALVQLSERIGGWVITEGIENRDDALTALQLGGDLLQGFYLGQPEPLPEGEEAARAALRHPNKRLRETGAAFKRFALEKTKQERAARAERWRVARSVRFALEHTPLSTTPGVGSDAAPAAAAQAEAVLREAIAAIPLIESACLLNERGIQITDTVLAPGPGERPKSLVYAPPEKGSDHSLKEYFYLLMEMPLPDYETPPYVPLPNTDRCITVTLRCKVPSIAPPTASILCLHLRAERGVLSHDTAPPRITLDSPEMPRRHDGYDGR